MYPRFPTKKASKSCVGFLGSVCNAGEQTSGADKTAEAALDHSKDVIQIETEKSEERVKEQ